MQAKVKYLRVSAGPSGVIQAGTIMQMAQAQAESLADAGVVEITGLVAEKHVARESAAVQEPAKKRRVKKSKA